MIRTSTRFTSLAAMALLLALPLAQASERGDHMKQLDTNGDGQLSRDEVKSAPMLSAKFDEIDTDKNGQLSKEELKAYMSAHKDEMKAAAQAHKGEMMDKLDTDGDGFISKDEAAKFPRLAAAFDKLDTNHDGKLSPEELAAAKKH